MIVDAATARVFSEVLDDENLIECILIRLGFPTTLVRAALINKKWYHLASNPRFLRKFRERYPPHLLGFFAEFQYRRRQFMPSLLPAELAGIARLLKDSFPGDCSYVRDVHNGQFLMLESRKTNKLMVKRPLHPDQDATIFPSIQRAPSVGFWSKEYSMLSPSSDDDDSDGATIYHMDISTMPGIIFMRLSALRHDIPYASVTSGQIGATLPPLAQKLRKPPMITNGHIYLLTEAGYIIGVRLLDTECFTIPLPNNSEYMSRFHHLSPASSGSRFYYLHVDGFDLHVWRRRRDDGEVDYGWEAADRIYLPDAFGCYAEHIWKSVPGRKGWSEYVSIYAVGPDAESVYLGVYGDAGVYCLDTKTRVVKKIGEGYLSGDSILPVMMIWPPTFPAI